MNKTQNLKPEMSFYQNDNNYTIFESEIHLDNRISDIQNFFTDNYGKGKSEAEKDALYQSLQQLWKIFVNDLKESKYNFYLNRPQYKFLTDLILLKMEYDVNTVFFAIELTSMLGNMNKNAYKNDNELLYIKVNATEITYIYHLISKHKVKGLCKDAYTFSEILYKIGSISKIFNYYETISKDLSKEIQDWILTLDDGVTSDKYKDTDVEDTVQVESKIENI